MKFGASVRRVEDHRLLVGDGRFVDDIRLTDAAYMAVVRSQHAHARIRAINARVDKGVVAALTADDLPQGRDAIAFGSWLMPNAKVREAADPVVRSHAVPLLARDRVRYVGQPIAVVVTDSPATADDARNLIEIEYEPLPPLMDPEEALASDAPRLHDDWPDNLACSFRLRTGEPDRVLSEAPVVMRERFRVQRCAALPVEPRAAAAVYDPWADELTLYATTQMPFAVRDTLAELLAMPAPAVRVVAPDVGGGFGMKSMLYPEDMLVALLARRLRRPVRWTETRTEQFLGASHSRDQVHEIELAATRDGQILAISDRFIVDFGAYTLTGLVVPYNAAAHLISPYRIPHVRIEGRAAVTNKVPSGPYRGAGRPEASFAMNRAMDVLARRLEMDPAELRRRNLVTPDEMPFDTGLLYRDGAPLVLDGGDYPAMLQKVMDAIDYTGFRSEQTRLRSHTLRGKRLTTPSHPEVNRENRAVKPTTNGSDGGADSPWREAAETAYERGHQLGIGVTCFVEGTGVGPPEGATVEVAPDGTVFVRVSVASQGQGHATTLAQVCAAELGVPFDHVRVVGGDTVAPTFGVGTMASRTAVLLGNSVSQAAREVAQRARIIAATLLECSHEDLELTGGIVRVKGTPSRSIPLGALAGAAVPASPFAALLADPGLIATRYFKPETVTFTSAVHAATVDVDPATGKVDLLRYVAVEDCGEMINPTLVDGQVCGGIAQGIGAALCEELVYSSDGSLLTGSLADYAVPAAGDIPDIEVLHHSTPSPRNALGIRGIGEAGAIGGQAAVANAIADAVAQTGGQVTATPLSPQTIFGITDGR